MSGRIRITLLGIIALISRVHADAAFYCQNRFSANLKGYGDVNFYESCGDLCDCFVFELLCLKRSGFSN